MANEAVVVSAMVDCPYGDFRSSLFLAIVASTVDYTASCGFYGGVVAAVFGDCASPVCSSCERGEG